MAGHSWLTHRSGTAASHGIECVVWLDCHRGNDARMETLALQDQTELSVRGTASLSRMEREC
jgi:hypothetical protein